MNFQLLISGFYITHFSRTQLNYILGNFSAIFFNSE